MQYYTLRTVERAANEAGRAGFILGFASALLVVGVYNANSAEALTIPTSSGSQCTSVCMGAGLGHGTFISDEGESGLGTCYCTGVLPLESPAYLVSFYQGQPQHPNCGGCSDTGNSPGSKSLPLESSVSPLILSQRTNHLN